MINKCLGLIVLACVVAAGASCSPLDIGEQVADFDALEKYLTENVPSEEAAANFDHLKANMADLKQKPLREAIELLMKVSKISKECKRKEMPVLIGLAKTNVDLRYQTRVRLVFRAVGLFETLDNCPGQLKAINHEMIEGKGLDDFRDSFYPLGRLQGDQYIVEHGDHDWVLSLLVDAAEEDRSAYFGKAKDDKYVKVKNAVHQYEYALDTYLLKPCKTFVSNPQLDLFIEAPTAIYKLNPYVDLILEHRIQAGRMAWRRDTCNEFLNMSKEARREVYNQWKPS